MQYLLIYIYHKGSYTNHVATKEGRGSSSKNHNSYLVEVAIYVRKEGVKILKKMATRFVYGL